MMTFKGNSRSIIRLALALIAAGALVSGAQEVYAEGDADDAAMYQSLIDSLSRVEIHGFVSQGFLMTTNNNYLYTTTSDGDFRFNEIGINFSTSLTEKLHVGLQLFSRSLGYVGDNAIQLDWAYADYRYEDWLGLRVGKMKLPLGMYNEIRDIDQLRTSIIMPQSVYPESGRAYASGLLGLGLYGEAPVEKAGSFSYSFHAGTMNASDAEDGLLHLIASQVAEFSSSLSGGAPTQTLNDDMDLNAGYNLVGSLFWNTPFDLDGLRIGATVQYAHKMILEGTYSTPGQPDMDYAMKIFKSIMWIASVEYLYENATLAFEFRDMKADLGGMPGMPGFYTIPLHQQGLYGLVSYGVTDSLELGTYYSMMWPMAANRKTASFANQPDHRAWQQDLAVSARYDIFDFWCVKVEGHWINGTGDLILLDNVGDDWSAAGINNSLEKDWFLGAIKTSVMF